MIKRKIITIASERKVYIVSTDNNKVIGNKLNVTEDFNNIMWSRFKDNDNAIYKTSNGKKFKIMLEIVAPDLHTNDVNLRMDY